MGILERPGYVEDFLNTTTIEEVDAVLANAGLQDVFEEYVQAAYRHPSTWHKIDAISDLRQSCLDSAGKEENVVTARKWAEYILKEKRSAPIEEIDKLDEYEKVFRYYMYRTILREMGDGNLIAGANRFVTLCKEHVNADQPGNHERVALKQVIANDAVQRPKKAGAIDPAFKLNDISYFHQNMLSPGGLYRAAKKINRGTQERGEDKGII